MARMPVVVGAAVAVLLAAGCGLTGQQKKPAAAQLPTVSVTSPQPVQTLDAPAPEPTSPAPATPPATTKPPKPKPSKTTAKPAAAPTEEPFWEQLPACAHRDSTKPASKSQVKSVLQKAAGRVYWQHEAPQLRINYPLVKAVAMQESGWQSNIHNCDGGSGVMQVMPGTVDMINQRFGLTYDPANLQDNAYIGGNYLAWLTKWMGDHYFKGDNYSLSASKCKSATSWCLLNTVIAGYNAGSGGVDAMAGSK